jgi:hypothetical protein
MMRERTEDTGGGVAWPDGGDRRSYAGFDLARSWRQVRDAIARRRSQDTDCRRLVRPSAYVNAWRLRQWRELFASLSPGHAEILEQFEHPETFGPRIVGDVARDLAGYDREELLTVNAVFFGRKA